MSSPPHLEPLSQALLRLYGLDDPVQLPLALAQVAAEFVPCAQASFNFIPAGGTGIQIVRSNGIRIPVEEESPLVQHLDQHCLIQTLLPQSSPRVLMFADFHRRPQFERLALYNEYYRRSNTQDQMGFGVHWARAGMVFLAFSHVGRDRFGEPERRLASLLQPHFQQIYRLAYRWQANRQAVRAWERLGGEAGCGVVLLTPEGTVKYISPPAEASLRRFCGHAVRAGGTLPERVTSWLRRVEHRAAHLTTGETLPLLEIESPDGGRLAIAYRPAQGQTLAALHLADKPAPRRVCDARWGLTPREAEVTHWVVEGKSNPEIATILGCGVRTVHKHMERILAKAGLENRQALLRTILVDSP